MVFRAVIFDIGGVLAVTEEMDFDAVWERRLGLERGQVLGRLAEMWPAGSLGTITENTFRDTVIERLGLDARRADEFIADMWRQYLGQANRELIAYAKTLRPGYRTGIISNSFIGARERERAAYGFEDLVDNIVYSHEVGLAKPDPAIYATACERLAVAPDQVVFVDDAPIAVDGAVAAGMTAIHHTGNATTIAALDELLHAPAD